jgi:hypothetical protein
MKDYTKSCDGCIRSQGKDTVQGGIVELKGDWILNHISGEGGFLGWVILQPRYHRMGLADLESDELSFLGENIQKIDIALESYWNEYFENDSLERVYVTYFFESAYDKPNPEKFHLHIHLIPRPISFDKLLRECVPNSNNKSYINAWKIYTLPKYKNFPPEYVKTKENVTNLMEYLRDILQCVD